MEKGTPGHPRLGVAPSGSPGHLPTVIGVHGARHNNLENIDVDVPLWRTVAVVGLSGSGKTSLAIGTLYAEGMQRFLESLSTYSRRRLTQAQRPDVDRIDHLPPALALRQRPPTPGPRSTVGTMSEVLNVLRLMMSRLGSHLCPNGHRIGPSIASYAEEITCPECGARFEHPSAESFSFNSYGACPACQGLGIRSEVDINTLVPDPGKTIEEGAVLPWNSGGRRLSMYAAGELGVRLDVPYQSLTERERDIVLHGKPVRRPVTLRSGRNGRTVQLSVNYDNAIAAVERSLRGNNERTRHLVQRFLVTRVCSVCHGARLRPEALTSQLGGRNIAEITALALDELSEFTAGLPAQLPTELNRLTTGLLAELNGSVLPLLDVGLGYLTLDRPGASLSTGELQRIELTSTVRTSTTGMLYVLDEPSVGLHPTNVHGLRRMIKALAENGNTVVVVEHERELIRAADWIIELGPGAGVNGGRVIAQGTPGQVGNDPHSIMGPFLGGAAAATRDRRAPPGPGRDISIEIADLYNLHDLTVAFPVNRLTALAGPSGAGKTALILDSLVPAARALLSGWTQPGHVRRLDLGDIRQVVQIDASPIGQNARSTPATYSGAFDQIRRVFAESAYARRRGWKPGHFSFNTREGQCPTAAASATSTSTSSTYPTSRSNARPAMARASTTPPWLSGSTTRASPMCSASASTTPWSGSPTGPRSRRRCARSPRLAWATCGSASRRPPCPGASLSGCGLPPSFAPVSAAHSTSSTSRPPACTLSTWQRWSECSTGCWGPERRSSLSTTTWTCSVPPTTSSTWARAVVRRVAASWRRGHRRTWLGTRAA